MKADQMKFYEIMKIFTFRPELFEKKAYTSKSFRICLNLHENLEEIMSQCMEDIKNLVNEHFLVFDF